MYIKPSLAPWQQLSLGRCMGSYQIKTGLSKAQENSSQN